MGNHSLGRFIQAKLKIGQPGDKYEKEADRVADHVMRMPAPVIQRKEEEEERIAKTKGPSNKTPEMTSDIEKGIQSLKGGGQPLSEDVRTFFEPRFGYNFSKVRMHNGAQADNIARSLNARAFTIGQDVVFGSRQYSNETSQGKRLLAHELTHVIQQGKKADGVKKKTKNNSDLILQKWSINWTKNRAKCNKPHKDTLSGLAAIVSGSGKNWPCIRPIYMRSRKATGTGYQYWVNRNDRFDFSNLRLKTGPSVNLCLVTNRDPYSLRSQYGKAIVKLYGGKFTTDPEWDIEDAAKHGRKPIRQLILSGHTDGSFIYGDNAFWDVSRTKPEGYHKPIKEFAENWYLPPRCWFTRNARVRIVGCCSKTVAAHFRKAFLRKGSRVTGTTKGICGWDHPYKWIYMTFNPSCSSKCPWPRGKKCFIYMCMNNQRTKWKTLRGRL